METELRDGQGAWRSTRKVPDKFIIQGGQLTWKEQGRLSSSGLFAFLQSECQGFNTNPHIYKYMSVLFCGGERKKEEFLVCPCGASMLKAEALRGL